MNLLFDIALKSFGLLILALGLCYLMRMSSPALRHRILALSFIGLLGLPILAMRLPKLNIERPTPLVIYSPGQSRPIVKAVPLSRTAPAPMPRPASSGGSEFILPEFVLLLWSLGFVITLGRTIRSLAQVAALPRQGADLPVDPSLMLPPHIRLVRSPHVDIPVTYGFLRPTILLPASSENWPEARTRSVLLHEGAHVRRADWLWLILSRFGCALYWFNPLAHWAAARMRLEAEFAADDAVLNAGIDTATYASVLVDLADGLRRRPMSASLPFVEAASLKGRVVQILSGSSDRKPLGRNAALVAVALCAVFLIPYAAMRIVEGPSRVANGIVPLADGRHLEVIAITEMKGTQATSWDARGARMPRPFPVGDTNRRELGPVPSGQTVRYVILRSDEGSGEIPTLQDPSGEPLLTVGYVEQTDGTGQAFRDAVGGYYFVTRISAPSGARTTKFDVVLPTTDWKLLSSRDFQKGMAVGLFNPTVDIYVAPMNPARGKGTEATFNLHQELDRSEAMVRFLPVPGDDHRFVGGSGSMTAYSSMPMEQLTRVEILTRKMKKVEFVDFPLVPNPSATYVQRCFLPDSVTEANGAAAKLPDGTVVTVLGMDDGKSKWNTDGLPPAEAIRFPSDINSKGGRRGNRNLWVQTQSELDVDVPRLFDQEGWPMFGRLWTAVYSEATLQGFRTTQDDGLTKRDIVAPVAAGPRKDIDRIQREAKGSKWIFSAKEGWTGSLRIEYPASYDERVNGMECEIRPLDANGDVVVQPGTARTSESSSGWIEFDLPKAKADRVKSIEFRARPYHWVKFDDIALRPRNL